VSHIKPRLRCLRGEAWVELDSGKGKILDLGGGRTGRPGSGFSGAVS